jgi:hypothetical protein
MVFHYSLEHAKNIADFKAVSLNAMYFSMEITDESYSNLNDGEIQHRIDSLGKEKAPSNDALALIKEFIEWMKKETPNRVSLSVAACRGSFEYFFWLNA